MNEVAIIGAGYVGSAYQKLFPNAVMYDPFRGFTDKEAVNRCGLAIVAVPTDLLPDGSLDMSIVDEVVSWLETPLIVIKSALMPGTVDVLKARYGKRITVSVEMIGEGKYFLPPWKYPHPTDPTSHDFLIIGGDDRDTTEVAECFWGKMSPDIDIHLISAVEAEICKLMENTWIGLKVSFANTIYDICQAYNGNYTKVLQAWGADGRVEKVGMRVVGKKRGWQSKCLDKDIPAITQCAKNRGVDVTLLQAIMDINRYHLEKNKEWVAQTINPAAPAKFPTSQSEKPNTLPVA